MRVAWRLVLSVILPLATISSITADSGKPLATAETAKPDRTSTAAKAAIERFKKMGGQIEGHTATIRKEWAGGNDGLSVVRDIPGIKRVVCLSPDVNDAGMDKLAAMSNVEDVSICWTKITDDGLRRLSRMPSLKRIELENDGITNAGISHLAEIKTLEWILVGKSKQMELNEDLFTSLGALPNLNTLIIAPRPKSKCKGLGALRNARNLRCLGLAEVGVDDDDLKGVERLTSLRYLDLRSTRVTDAGVQYLAKLTNLEELSLSYTGVTDVGIRWLAHLERLNQLWLSGAEITDEGMAVVGDLTKLEGLTVTGCQRVTDRSLASIRKLKHLKRLTANSAGMTDEGLATLWNDLPELTIIGVKNGLPAKKGERLDRMPVW